MSKRADFLSWEAGAPLGVLLLIVAYVLVGYLTLSPGHAWGDDWAQYVSHARNLVTGRAYSDTGYIFNPDAPHVGPPSYPPGLPLLLAPIIRIAGLDIIALKCVSLVCMGAGIGVAYLLFREALGTGVSACAAFLFGLHEFSWSLRDYIVSEPPYILWTLLSLYFSSRRVRSGGIASGIFCGLFAYAAFATRSIGIVLIASVVLYEIAQRGFYQWRVLCIAGIPIIAALLQRHFITLPDYSAELHAPTVPDVLANAAGYWQALASLFPLGGKLSLVSPGVIAALALLGVTYRTRSSESTAKPATTLMDNRGSPTWMLLKRIPVDLWYASLYLAALLVLPFQTNSRYLVPILPVLCAYAAYGAYRALTPTRYARPALLGLFAACMCYYAALYWAHRATDAGDNALCDDCLAMYAFIRQHTQPGAKVAFARPRALALLADRHAWVWANDSRAFRWSQLKRTGISYIVVVPPAHRFAPRYPAQLNWDAAQANSDLTLVFENPSFRVLRFARNGG